MAVEYIRDLDAMLWLRSNEITFRAVNVRKEGGNVKAEVSIIEGTRLLDEDDLAVKRREERIRLANACHKMLNGTAASYPQDQMQHDLLLFCRDLWDAWIGESTAVRTSGDMNPTEPEFLVEDYVLADAGTILFAPPGMGKSWTALLLAVSVDAGLDTIWRCRQGPVHYINLERSDASFARRLGQVNETLGMPRDRSLLMTHARGRSLTDVFDGAKKTVQKEGVVLTVIDSLSRAGGGSLIKDDVANKSMDMANALGSAWLFLAHTPRADETHAYGSQMFDAAADVTIQLRSENADAGTPAPRLGVALKVEKANDIAPAPRRIWTFGFDRRFGITEVYESGRGEWPELEDDGVLSPQDRVVELLRDGAKYVGEIAEALGKDAGNVSRWIKDLESQKRVIFVRQNGPRRYYGLPSNLS